MKYHVTEDGLFRAEPRFSPEEADALGRVRTEALLYRFQEIAAAHYDSLGLGRDAARSRGCLWALTRTELRFRRAPLAGEPLYLDTWVGRQGHGLFWRHYRLSAPGGEALAMAVSTWVIMDMSTRTLTRDHAWAVAPRSAVEGQLAETLRGPAFPETLPRRAVRAVTARETDENGHLNNTLYIPWARELLPPGFTESHAPRALYVEYRKELTQGQETLLQYALDGDILYLKGYARDKECFSLRADYDQI